MTEITPPITPAADKPSVIRAFWNAGQRVALSRTTDITGIGSPTDGGIYIVPSDAVSNANDIAFRVGGAWTYLTPEKGWSCFIDDEDINIQFDGVDWVEFAGAGGGGGVTVVSTSSISEVIKTITPDDTTGLYVVDVTGYNNVRVYARNLTIGSTQNLEIGISDDGGVTVEAMTRHNVGDAGTNTNFADSYVDMGTGTSLTASATFHDLALASPAKASVIPNISGAAYVMEYQQDTSTVINALVIQTSSAGNMTGGEIIVTGERHAEAADGSIFATATLVFSAEAEKVWPIPVGVTRVEMAFSDLHGSVNNQLLEVNLHKASDGTDALGSGAYFTDEGSAAALTNADWFGISRGVVSSGGTSFNGLIHIAHPRDANLKSRSDVRVLPVGAGAGNHDFTQTLLIADTAEDHNEIAIKVDTGTLTGTIEITYFIDPVANGAQINTQIGMAYTIGLTDLGGIVEMDSASANTLTIDTEANFPAPIGSISNVTQLGAGSTTIQAVAGVMLNGVDGGSVTLSARYLGASLYKRASDEWIAQGSFT